MNRYKLIGIEPISENEIASYTFEGTEIQEKPLNPNEEFIQLTNKIDFKKLNGKTLDYTYQSFYCNDEESEPIETHQANVTEKLKKHVGFSIDEMNALIDILRITTLEKRSYMKLKKIHKDPSKDLHKDGHDETLPSYITGKKMALSATAVTLTNGAIRLSNTLSSLKDQHHQNTFYSDLALLRREWRIKWFQTHLVGDLGLSSSGSVFPEQSGFQIIEEDDKCSSNSSEKDIDLQSLKIVLMHNQEGEPIMRINLKDSLEIENEDDEVRSFKDLPPAKDLKCQTDRLNRGQNLLFLHEIYSTISFESRLVNSPVQIKENRICINLKGRKNIVLDFFILPEKHWFGYESNVEANVLEIRTKHEDRLRNRSIFSDTLILLLRELMREKHRCNLLAYNSISNPIAGPVQIPLNRRFHGVHSFRPIDYSPTEQSHRIYLLQPLINAIIFQKARRSILSALDHVALKVSYGISVNTHLNALQSMFNCSMLFTISSTTYTNLSKQYIIQLSVYNTVIHINITSDQIRHQLAYDDIDSDILKCFFESQVWNFKIDVIKQLATVKYNWELINMRLTNCQKSVQHDVQVGIVILSSDSRFLISIKGDSKAKKYKLSVSCSTIEEGVVGKSKMIDLARLEARMIKSDLEIIDVILTAFK